MTAAESALIDPIAGSDVLLSHLLVKWQLSPAAIAGTVLATGFIPLALLYWYWQVTGNPAVEHRGLFEYYSATIGDALLLPTMAFVTTSAYSICARLVEQMRSISPGSPVVDARLRRLEASLGSQQLGLLPGSLALVLTVAIHALWLSSPGTEYNWTIQETLNSAGILHAVFFTYCLWLTFAYVTRVILVARAVSGCAPELCGSSAPVRAMRLWEGLNATLFLSVGFAVLLYLDNYGFQFSWTTLRTSPSTLMLLAVVLVAVLATNVWGYARVFLPFRRGCIGARSRVVALSLRGNLMIGAAGVLLSLALFQLATILPQAAAWTVAAVLVGLAVPVLVTENIWADAVANQGRRLEPVAVTLLVCAFLVSSAGLLSGLAASSSAMPPEVTSLGDLSWPYWVAFWWAVPTLLLCSGVAWLLLRYLPDRRATNQSAIHNIVQNQAQYLLFYQAVIVPVAMYVHQLAPTFEASLSPEGLISLLYAFSGVVALAIGIPLRNNYEHLRQMESERQHYRTFESISAHVLFITYVTAAIAVVLVAWLWLAAIDRMIFRFLG